MKNKKHVVILLYVFSVLALIYALFACVQANATYSSYYGGTSSYSVSTLIVYLISSCFEPLCFTVLFFGLGNVIDILIPKKEEKEEKKPEQNDKK